MKIPISLNNLVVSLNLGYFSLQVFSNFIQFNDSVERASAYIKQLEQYFMLLNVFEERTVAGIFSNIRPQLYDLLCNFCLSMSGEK